jgi:hypothetical protein
MLGRWIGAGQKKENTATAAATMDAEAEKPQQQQPPIWSIGQIVDVRARTWVG